MMNTSDIATLASNLSQSRTADAVQMLVLKKSMDLSAQGGMQLVQAATQAANNNPPHLGSQIDTYA